MKIIQENVLTYFILQYTMHRVTEKTMYPAMTQEEVEDWLAHIPVYAVTDDKGSGIVLKPDDESSVFYFFMSPQMANATLNQLKGSNDDLELRISAFSLGKIWFKVLKNENETPVQVCCTIVYFFIVDSCLTGKYLKL